MATSTDSSYQSKQSARSSIIVGKQPLPVLVIQPKTTIEYKYGWGRITPDCLQCLNTPSVLLLCLSLLLTIQGALVYGIIPASITHLQRRFHFSGAEIGALISVYDVGFAMMLFPVSRYGGYGHKSRWIGASAMLAGFASLICTLPHFLAEPYQYGGLGREQYCNQTTTIGSSDCTSASMGKWKAFFYVGEFLFGIAASPLYTIAITYLDENVSRHMSSTYIGIYSASTITGPCIGHVIAAVLSPVYGYTHVSAEDRSIQSPEDPRWYGGWWMGMLGGGVVCCILAISILGFSRELPVKNKGKSVETSIGGTTQLVSTSLELTASLTDWDNVKSKLKSVLRNPTYVCLIVEQVATIFVMQSFATFSTMYMETQFSMTTAKTSFAAAAVTIAPSLLGTVIGTFLQRHLRLRCKGNILLAIIVTTIATALWSIFFVTCPTRAFADVNSQEAGEMCNSHCNCRTYQYEPYCWSNESISFFSQCHAGCDETFTNCSCVEAAELAKNLCGNYCQTHDYIWFLLGFGALTMFVSIKKNPVQQAILRCVPFQMRTFALALGWIPLRLIGSTPANPLIGFLMSNACLKWQERCGEKEVCVLYDNQALASSVQLTGVISFFVAHVALIVAWKSYVRPEGEWYRDGSDHSTLEEALRSTWKEPVVEP